MYDTIIIGYGPCGISTAIYLKRFGYNVLVIGKDRGALEKPTIIENYYGVLPINGSDLIDLGIKQAKDLGVEIIDCEMVEISKYKDFEVKTTKGSFQAKSIMLAMGKSRAKHAKAVPFEGRGVSYCATCDGFFYRNKRIAMVGNSHYLLEELNVLKNLTKNITIFTDGKHIEFETEFNVIEDKITDFVADDMGNLASIKAGEHNVEVDGCFMAIGSASGFSLASHLGIVVKGEDIVVNENYMTNIDGLFAGGDIIGGLMQIVKAANDGAHAAMGIKKYLISKK